MNQPDKESSVRVEISLPKEMLDALNRAERYSGFVSPGRFLSDSDVDELHKRVGHITLMNVRYKEKDWGPLIEGSMPIATDRLFQFFRFLADSHPSLSSPIREDVRLYIKTLEGLKTVV